MAAKFPIIRQIKGQLNWLAYANTTHNIVGLECEKGVLEKAFHVPAERISIVPLGLSDNYRNAGSGSHSETHLITTGTITQRKNSVELAQMAHAAQVPVLFVGKPYHPNDPYWRRFQSLVDDRWVKHHPHVGGEREMIALLQAARGFVIMSQFENWCLSAHEAAACGLPLLVQDQKWSRERFGDTVRYFADIGVNAENTTRLKRFYADAPDLPAPVVKLLGWREVAHELKKVYEQVMIR